MCLGVHLCVLFCCGQELLSITQDATSAQGNAFTSSILIDTNAECAIHVSLHAKAHSVGDDVAMVRPHLLNDGPLTRHLHEAVRLQLLQQSCTETRPFLIDPEEA